MMTPWDYWFAMARINCAVAAEVIKFWPGPPKWIVVGDRKLVDQCVRRAIFDEIEKTRMARGKLGLRVVEK
jgi:hypothetical protein